MNGSSERRQGIFTVADIPFVRSLPLQEWNAVSQTFVHQDTNIERQIHVTCSEAENEAPCDDSMLPWDPDPSEDLESTDWQLAAVQLHASRDDLIDAVLRGNTYFLEFTEDGQVIFLMPAHRLRNSSTACDRGVDAIPTVPDGPIQYRNQCPFVLLRLRVMTFKGGDKVFVCECSNPGCTRSRAARELFLHQFPYPDQTGSWRDDILQEHEPLCECMNHVIRLFWVDDEPEQGEDVHVPTEQQFEGVPDALVQWYLDQDPGGESLKILGRGVLLSETACADLEQVVLILIAVQLPMTLIFCLTAISIVWHKPMVPRPPTVGQAGVCSSGVTTVKVLGNVQYALVRLPFICFGAADAVGL